MRWAVSWRIGNHSSASAHHCWFFPRPRAPNIKKSYQQVYHNSVCICLYGYLFPFFLRNKASYRRVTIRDPQEGNSSCPSGSDIPTSIRWLTIYTACLWYRFPPLYAAQFNVWYKRYTKTHGLRCRWKWTRKETFARAKDLSDADLWFLVLSGQSQKWPVV